MRRHCRVLAMLHIGIRTEVRSGRWALLVSRSWLCAAIALLPCLSRGQDSARFEAVSVRVNNSGEQFFPLHPLPGGRINIVNATVRVLIQNAYRVLQNDLVVGGPAWISNDRFDIAATAGANRTMDELSTMLQTLLAERFALRVHRERREMPVYA